LHNGNLLSVEGLRGGNTLMGFSIASIHAAQTLDEMAKLAVICRLDGAWRTLFKRISGDLAGLGSSRTRA